MSGINGRPLLNRARVLDAAISGRTVYAAHLSVEGRDRCLVAMTRIRMPREINTTRPIPRIGTRMS